MKFLIIFALTLITNKSQAITFEIQNPCEKIPFASGNLQLQTSNALEITKLILHQYKIKNETSDNGILSIENFVSGDKKLEIISESKMRAYGWCFSINGSIPDLMPDQILLKSNEELKWFLAYSTYDNGQWIDYCKEVIANHESQKFICQN